MNVDRETLARIAHLARLNVEEQAEAKMLDGLNAILTWMEKLNEIDTSNVEPLTHMSTEVNMLREDQVLPPLDHERGLRNAPKRDSDYFRVPKVID